MIKGVWNYAIKVKDLERTTAFYIQHLGAEVRLRSRIEGCQYHLLSVGETRLILSDKAPYEDELGWDLPAGFLHVVFESDDFESDVELASRSGAHFFVTPRVISGEFGRRKVAFFEGPDGIRTEIMQVLEDSVES